MPPDKITNINDIGLVFVLFMGLLLFLLPRRFAFVPLLLAACYITLGQVIVVAGLSFTMLRIMLLFGWARLILRKEICSFTPNGIDKAIIYWMVASVVTSLFLDFTSATLINRLGLVYNAAGTYFLFRFLIWDFDDINRLISLLAIIIVPLAVAMTIEGMTGINVFSVFGGVPESTLMREGRARCQGSFGHPILAGTFGAASLPFFIGLWFRKDSPKLLAIVGTAAAATIILKSSSSGPASAAVFGVVGLALWPLRKHMRLFRWGVLLTLIALHLLMKAPVWYLIARLGNLTGGTGWHRAELIDAAIERFSEWWLFGTTYTAHWLMHDTSTIPGMVDITNQYILEGVNGGLLRLWLFVMVIVSCFKGLGNALRAMEEHSLALRLMLWTMGVALIAHVVSFMSVSYFDQISMFWYLLLAMISTSVALSNQSASFLGPLAVMSRILAHCIYVLFYSRKK